MIESLPRSRVAVLLIGAGAVFFTATVVRTSVQQLSSDDPDWLTLSFTASAFPGGIFNSQSAASAYEDEVKKTVQVLQLKPGMTYCEMGAANGLWATGIAASAMPGGRIVATVGTVEEKGALLQAAARANIPASVERGTETVSGFPRNASCDVIMSRMSFFFVTNPNLYANQFYAALKPGGMMLISDHGPMTGEYTGPRGPTSFMKVTMPTEKADFEAAGFKLVEQYDWSNFFSMGFANLFTK